MFLCMMIIPLVTILCTLAATIVNHTVGNMNIWSPEYWCTKRLRQVIPSPFLVHRPASSFRPSAFSDFAAAKRGHALVCPGDAPEFHDRPSSSHLPVPIQSDQSHLRNQPANQPGLRGAKNDTRNPHPKHHVSAPLAVGGTRRTLLTPF